jgi:hypothetical protein
VTELLTELFALTRMNWNSADFASADPITLAFSRVDELAEARRNERAGSA